MPFPSLHVAVLVVLSACGGGSEVADEGTSSGAETTAGAEIEQDELAVARVTIPAEPIAALPAPADEATLETSDDSSVHDPESDAQEMDSGLAALAAAMDAAQHASVGATLCESAYNGAMAMVGALQAHSPSASPPNIPTRASFLSGCNQLPVEAQQCMTMQHAMANQARCGVVMQTPAVQAFRQSMRPTP